MTSRKNKRQRRCPGCKETGAVHVLDSRPLDDGRKVYRRLNCKACGHSYGSVELPIAELERLQMIEAQRASLRRIARILAAELEELVPVGATVAASTG